ncbi:MAG TPA: alpha/beta hydrolase [Streptosporangiaceae bacterium]|nr:alpha/beta hydrolase [Streptosporangiaceae bacterium]
MSPPVTLPGQLISVAGQRSHVVVDGPADAPPVLLSNGLGGAWFDWQPTVDLLRDRHRVIRFDRPGLGGSPPLRAAPTLPAEAARLAALARWAGRPVIVAAHSYAAFHAEALARTRPGLVAGMILVDPSCESAARPRPHLSRPATPLLGAVGWLAGATGAARLLGPWARSRYMRRISHHDPVPRALVRAVYGRGSVAAAALTENVAYGEMAGDLIALRRVRPFPEIPVTVLTALGGMRSPGRRRAWTASHRRLAAMSPYGRQITLADARHLVQTDRPDAVAEAITELGSRQ